MIEKYLEELESRIEPAVEDTLLAEWKEFTFGRSGDPIFRPVRPRKSPPSIPWPDVPVNEALADYERMALQQFKGCSDALAGGAGTLLSVRCNYGISILPSLFGAELYVMESATNTLPNCRPLAGGNEALRRLAQHGVPDLTAGQGAQVFEMGRRFMELTAPFPNLRRYVHVYHPDLQGAMDVCELLWGSGIFTDFVDRPELVHDVLRVIADTYVAFMRKWDALMGPSPEGWAVHWGLMHRGHIMLREDSAMNLSPDMYDEFIRPYDGRLLTELGGGALHFCGRGDHYIDKACAMEGLHAIAMSQPELNDMETIYRQTVDRGIKLIGFSSAAAEESIRRSRDLGGHVQC